MNSFKNIVEMLPISMTTPRVSSKKIVSEYYGIPSKLKKNQLKEYGFNKQKDLYNFYISLFEDEVGDTPTQFIRKQKIKIEAFKRERNKRINNYKSKIVEDHIHGFKNTKYITNTRNEKELYENAIKRMEEDGYYGQLVLNFISNNDNKIRKTTIAPSYLDSYEEFKNRLEKIRSGEVVGSDNIPDNQYNLVDNTFNIVNTNITGGGSSKFMIFETRGINSKTNNCWKECLDDCNIECGDKKYNNLIDLCDLVDEYNNININNKVCVIGNSFSYKTNQMNTLKNKENIWFECGNREFKGVKPTIEDIKLVYLNKITNVNECKKIIIYDELNKHFDIIDELKINNDILLSRCNKVFKNTEKGYKLLFTPTEINKTNKLNDFVNNYKVFFDYETVIDFEVNNCMKEYSCSILVLDDKDLNELDEIDISGDKKKLHKFLYPNNRAPRVICFKGFDCSTQLLNWIYDNQINYLNKENNRFDFVSFNGSNFDNFILLNALLKQDENDLTNKLLNVSDVFYNGNQILNFKINKKHSTFDIRKHLVGSLKSCCKGFNVNMCGKLDFDHNKAQKLYQKGKLIDYITDNQELEDYNNMDCISLAIIFKRYKDALINMPQTKKYGEKLTDNKTIGGIIYNIFKDHTRNLKMNKKDKLKFEKLDKKYYKDILKYKCAGRVEMFNGVQEILEGMVSLDICSMYPFVMAVLKDAYYPCGKITEVNKFDNKKIGFYYCDIDQSILRTKNLPNIYPKKNYKIKKDGSQGELIGNDWDTTEVLENYLISSVMIKQLKSYGCIVDIKSGITFQDKMRGCDLFEFILEFMMKKNEQDINKKEKPELYNSALRETLKLLMNSLSGKVIEGLHTDKTEMTTSYEFQQLLNRMDDDDEGIRTNNIESINAINFVGNKVFTSYKVSEDSELSKQRPIYLGVMIYDYSKCYIYDTLYAVVGLKDLVYTDTDAGKFRKRILKRVMAYYTTNYVPYWDKVLKYDKRYKGHKLYDSKSKVFGSYENEMDELPNNDKFYCFQKKSWVCIDTNEYNNGNRDKSYKMSFKGVPKNAVILPNLDFKWIKKTYNKEGSKKDFEIEIINSKECLDYYQEGTSITNNLIEFCNELYNNKYIYVLTQNFKRVVKNTNRNVISLEDKEKLNLMNNTIQVQPVIKRITIK